MTPPPRGGGVKWHLESLTPGCRETARRLGESPRMGAFYLAGGTALALAYGHRVSVDLDFFSSTNPLGFVERQALLEDFRKCGMEVEEEKDGTVHGRHKATHVSFFRYPNPLLRPVRLWDRLRVAHPVDIGLMKLGAIIGRGSRKDFIDLYFILERELSLARLLRLIPRKFPGRRDVRVQALRALVYFADADAEPPPKVAASLSWARVKAFFEREVRSLARKLS